ncbi:hypothetical protein M413DRAFT_444939, partial [Hebeloma cylindrosporum]
MTTRPLLSGFSRQLVQTLSLTLKQLRYLPSFKFKSLGFKQSLLAQRRHVGSQYILGM